MAGHEWKDWFEREEFIGQISDIRVQNLQVERELVQKRTFTRWINLHLEKCDPKMEVQDLFRDIQDGRVLMALLDELSGCKLLHGFKKSAHRIFRLNNIAKVLSFLEERNVKLVSIDATDVADGNPSIVLGLIWNIILFFQIKELTGNIKSQFPSSSSLSSMPTGSDPDARSPSGATEERRQASLAMRDQGRTIKKLLQWVQNRTRKFGVAVQDFSKSWTSGLAFLAVIKSIDSSLVDMRRALLRSAKENLEEAFRTAHFSLGIPRLLEPEDVTLSPPDEQSIMTYVSQFLEHFPGKEEPIKPHEVIERSISMGRLSSCDTELDQIRNGLHRSRLRERPYVVRKEPPPKIFISSMSEDRGLRSPTSPLAVARSWASEDSPVGSPLAAGGVFFISTSTSPQPYYINSPVGSESAIGDSAMGSPDSWVGSEAGGEAPEGLGESRSDGSLCDSGMAWDVSVPYASPEEDATLDPTSTSLDKPQEEDATLDLTSTSLDKPQEEDATLDLTSFSLDKLQEDAPLDLTSTSLDKPQEDAPLDLTSPSLDKPQEEQQFVDEGIYSLSSLESTQERIQVQSEKEEEEEEEEANWHILHRNQEGASERVPDHKEDENKAEKDSEQMDTSPLQRDRVSTEQRSSLGLYETPPQPDYGDAHSPEPKGTNQSQSSYSHPTDGTEEGTDGESECAEEAAELREGPQLQGQNVETESEGARHGADHEYHQPGRVAIKESCILYLVEEIEVETVRRRKDSLSEKEVEEAGILKGEVREGSEMQNEMSQGVLNDHADPQEGAATQIPEDLANVHPEHSVAVDCGAANNQDGPLKSRLDSSTDLSGPQSQTFVPLDPPERGAEITCGPETEGQAGDEDPGLTGASGSREGCPIDLNVPENPNEISHDSDEPEDTNPLESALCLSGGPWAEKVHQVNSKHMKAMGHGHPGGTDERDTDSPGSQAAVDSPTLDRTDRPDGGFRDEPNGEAPGGDDEETADPRPDGSHRPVHSGEPATDMDFFYTEPLEPMDLFYPDKEEFTMFAEPLEAADAESDWSVFHVSALQPATPSPEPATPPPSSSDPEILCVFQETNIYLLPPETPQALSGDEGSSTVHLSTQEEQEEEMMVMMENHHPLCAPSEAQQWCSSGGEEDGEEERAWGAEPEEGQCPMGRDPDPDLWGRQAEGLPAGEIMEAVRTEAGGAMSPDESTVVCHRPGSPASKDNQTKVSSSKTHSNNFDLGTKEREELAVLLLLWLLLYCLWVLPQIDFSFSLLFNLDH